MRIFYRALLLCAMTYFCASCASDGSFVNPFADSEPASGASYYFSEFPDIPIPNEMNENTKDTFVTFAPSGVKCGVQRFTGRMDVVSLINTMRRNMSTQGWTLRALLRAKESMLVFEKADRIISCQIVDGLVFTEMRIFISTRLTGDSAAVQINTYNPPSSSGSGSSQSLSQ